MAGTKPFSLVLCSALFTYFLVLCTPVLAKGRPNKPDEDHDVHAGAAPGKLQTYIISVQKPASLTFSGAEDREEWYRSFLSGDAATEDAVTGGQPRWVYSYHEAFTGFAARLTEEEVTAMKEKEGFLRAYPDSTLHTMTTHSPEFIGLRMGTGLWGSGSTNGRLGEGVIIGMIDGGFTPGHPSFDDEGMPPPPSRWRGSCNPPQFCNKKIIGAKAFIADSNPATATPVDEKGHGTHTASIAAGSFVKGANVLGNANGTASGVAPRAHLAIYKVCFQDICQTSDILAGVDAAVADGVDILSISLGTRGFGASMFDDIVSIAAFRATQRGVLVSCAAGNVGGFDTLINDAPWILTVSASTMDRAIVAVVKLGDGSVFQGQSAFQPVGFTHEFLPLVLPRNNQSVPGMPPKFFCKPESLAGIDVKGKVVLCQDGAVGTKRVEQGAAVLKAGAAAMIIMNADFQGGTTNAAANVLPASALSFADGSKIIEYIRGTNNPTASISFEGTKIGSSAPPAPAVASFSSNGGFSTIVNTKILKPDVLGPGVNVLAAWHTTVGPSSTSPAVGGANFNTLSGTSMAAPHLSGVAALLKSAHPDWSPAAIRSAIITTASVKRNDGQLITMDGFLNRTAAVVSTGGGQVNASRAADPGLIFDIVPKDYISYVCDFTFKDSEQVSGLAGEPIDCAAFPTIAHKHLNYPSIAVELRKHLPIVSESRTVTNVGDAGETYNLELHDVTGGVAVKVVPRTLAFSAVGETKNFTVTFSKPDGDTGFSSEEGSLLLVSPKHVVKVPMSITVDLFE